MDTITSLTGMSLLKTAEFIEACARHVASEARCLPNDSLVDQKQVRSTIVSIYLDAKALRDRRAKLLAPVIAAAPGTKTNVGNPTAKGTSGGKR